MAGIADKERLDTLLRQHDHLHLLTFWDQLDESQRSELARDIDAINFDAFREARSSGTETCGEACEMEPPDAFPVLPTPELHETYAHAKSLGAKLLSENRVAAMVVAGGDATRLGYDAPKGAFSIAPVSHKCLFQLFAESIQASNDRFGCSIPWYVMTSPSNHAATAELFETNRHFGLDKSAVMFFQQGVMPVSDLNGRILLREAHRVAFAADGHGGSLTALRASGMLDDMAGRGVDYISYFQVDNPLINPVIPLFIGLHVRQRSQMSSLTIGKADDDEKVGQFVMIGGKLHVVEYTMFPETLKSTRTSSGRRKYDSANIAVHALDRSFVERITGDGCGVSLPWHRAVKNMSYFDVDGGRRIDPDVPNAIKYERFVFDALPAADRTMLLETTRAEHFSPVKNREGVDSVATARRDMIRRAAHRLESAGVCVPRTQAGEPDCVVEISPLFADDVESLRRRDLSNLRIEPGARVLLE